MPVIDAMDNNWKPVKRYDWPARYLCGTEYDAILRAWRKAAIVAREAPDTGKDEKREQLRTVRAITLMLPWLGTPDAGQEPVPPSLWPIELARELDAVSYRLLDVESGAL